MSEQAQQKTGGVVLPWRAKAQQKRRESDYKEKLSSRMLTIASVTALFVLLDPKVIVPIGDAGQVLTLGGAGFSLDIKGMVIGAIIIEGLKSIKEYWLGTSAGGQRAASAVERIAESSAPATAAAVLEATKAKGNTAPASMKVAGDVALEADGDVILQTTGKGKPDEPK